MCILPSGNSCREGMAGVDGGMLSIQSLGESMPEWYRNSLGVRPKCLWCCSIENDCGSRLVRLVYLTGEMKLADYFVQRPILFVGREEINAQTWYYPAVTAISLSNPMQKDRNYFPENTSSGTTHHEYLLLAISEHLGKLHDKRSIHGRDIGWYLGICQ